MVNAASPGRVPAGPATEQAGLPARLSARLRARVPAAVLPMGRTAGTYLGLATPGLHLTPSFLICGAQRCGTTSMFQALRGHPAVLRPALAKGVHYFDTDYRRGLTWYRAHFPFTAHAALRGRLVGHRVVTFESSPYYLFHPLAAARIARDLPEAKVVILLRDPVERAYSAYTHERARGFETESFERALELEDARLAGEQDKLVADPRYVSHAHQHQAYLHRGMYVEQVLRMTNALGPDRVHVVDAEDFFTDPDRVYQEVVDFLGLARERGREFRRHNARPRSAMPASLRRTLREHYLDADTRLATWWGRTPSWRRGDA